MIAYAVNEHTKEHKLSGPLNGMGWSLIYADDDGWIKHEGSKSPLLDGSVCEIKPWAGGMSKGRSEDIVWDNVAAYRPILDAKPEPPAWDGESWPIPIGTECLFETPDEYGMNSTWMNAKVVGHDGPACVVAVDGDGYHGSSSRGDFRPIRSDEDRAVEAFESVMSAFPFGDTKRELAELAYETIRDGKIPGVKITGDER